MRRRGAAPRRPRRCRGRAGRRAGRAAAAARPRARPPRSMPRSASRASASRASAASALGEASARSAAAAAASSGAARSSRRKAASCAEECCRSCARTAPSASAVRYAGLTKRESSRSCFGERPVRSRGAASGLAGATPPAAGLACSWASVAISAASGGSVAAWNQPETESRGSPRLRTSATAWKDTPGWTVKRSSVPQWQGTIAHGAVAGQPAPPASSVA